MKIYRLAFGTDPHFGGVSSEMCPYVPTKKDYCSASVMTVPINDRTRDHYCSSEDFDRCPLFLAKALRMGL
jgi:hypothetical protein